MWLFEGLSGPILMLLSTFSYTKIRNTVIFMLIIVNFKVYIKISFQLLSSNSKIMRTFALGLLAFRSICRS